ncbi:hypothetical protein BH23CHL5_BH23CHL5_17850 [soil metagenome]
MNETVSICIGTSAESVVQQAVESYVREIVSRTSRTLVVSGPRTVQGLVEAAFGCLSSEATVNHLQTRDRAGRHELTAFLRRSRWVESELGDRAPRLTTVRLPIEVIEADAIVVVSSLMSWTAVRPVIAVGLWSLIVSPVHRLGAAITGHREGLTAEIALAVRPAVVIVVDRIPSIGLFAAYVTADQIAAELAGLTGWQLRQPGHREQTPPWEDALVQRSTELQLGVQLPSDLNLRFALSSHLDVHQRERAFAWFEHFCNLVGVEQSCLSFLPDYVTAMHLI